MAVGLVGLDRKWVVMVLVMSLVLFSANETRLIMYLSISCVCSLFLYKISRSSCFCFFLLPL